MPINIELTMLPKKIGDCFSWALYSDFSTMSGSTMQGEGLRRCGAMVGGDLDDSVW